MEIWRNINDFYAVSNIGNVKSVEIEKELGYNNGAISACCRGERGYKTHKGFKWSYSNDRC